MMATANIALDICLLFMVLFLFVLTSLFYEFDLARPLGAAPSAFSSCVAFMVVFCV